MPDGTGNTSLGARWRAWLPFVLLVAAHAAINVFLNPMSSQNAGDEFPTLVWIGMVFVQPVLFATWTAMGPPPATKRIPLTIAALVLVLFAGCISPMIMLSGTIPVTQGGFALLVLPLSLFVVGLVAMFLMRILTRWRIENTQGNAGWLPATNQFSVKYLLVLTAICAVLLGIGRGLAAQQDWSDSPSLRQVGRMLGRVGIILLAVFPAIIVPLVVISPRPTLRTLAGTVISWVVLGWVAIETIVLVDHPPRGEVTYAVGLVHLGAGLASLASAFILRRAGYRLVTHAKGPTQALA